MKCIGEQLCDQDHRDLRDAVKRIAELEVALRRLVHACTRYDECPASVEMAEYASAKALAEKALREAVNI